jgi:Sap, sulfolipid-1-addressing protein
MNAEFFALAFLAAVNPKLLALDLLLIENRRPRAMFLWLLVGGLTVGVTIGLLDVLVFRLDAVNTQRSVGAGVDLALGLFLLVAGALVATGRLHGRRKAPAPAPAPAPAAGWQPQKREDEDREEQKEKKDGWAQRLLAEPRLPLAVLVGAVIGIPGASYLTALHHLVAGNYPTATEVIAVFVFVIISFLLIIVPYAFLELRPEATKARLKHSQIWLGSHAKRLIAGVALLLGAYLTISALVRLS